MRKNIKFKSGDTLIEVMIAIGIFSLVAISVVAVMNSGTSNIQTALETTMTRNEIDAQAEALRFIQSSYIAELNSSIKEENENVGTYTKIWEDIKGLANNADSGVASYKPESCDALYDKNELNNIYSQNAFVINTKQLSTPSNALLVANEKDFQPALLYPRIYDEGGSLLESSDNFKPEGIWVVGVKVDNSPHYDFYIRTCWYGAGAKAPSTVSTVIRLYDPGESKLEDTL